MMDDYSLEHEGVGSGTTTASSVEEVLASVHPSVLQIVDYVRGRGVPILYSPSSVFTQYERLEELGSGTYAKVYKIKSRKTNSICAGKLLCPDKFPEKTQARIIQMFSNEIVLLYLCQSPGTVALNCVVYSSDGLLLDQEYVSGGTIWRERLCPTVETIWSYLIQLVQAVDYLHSKGIVHRDLKPTNILMTEDSMLKLADFGWSEEIRKLRVHKSEWPGTLEINPPEILNFTGALTERIDNFAIGMNFLLFVSNRFISRQKGEPEDKAAAALMKSLHNVRVSKKLPPRFTTETFGLFTGLTHPDPLERWTLERVLHHPWVVRNFLYMMEHNSYDGKSLNKILWHSPTRRLLLSYRIPPSVQRTFESEGASNINCRSSGRPSTRLFSRLGRMLDWREA